MAVEWIWYECIEESNIFLAACSKSVMMMIFFILECLTNWLILHRIARSLASVGVTFMAWCSILITGLSYMWICEMDIATLFLMLASDMTRDMEESDDALRVRSLRIWMWFLMFFPHEWKEILSENESMRWFPRENSWLKGSKEGVNSFFLLSMLIRGLFKRLLWLSVSVLRDTLCTMWDDELSGEMIALIIWLWGREKPLERNWL